MAVLLSTLYTILHIRTHVGPSDGKVGMHAYVTKEEGGMGRTCRQVEGGMCVFTYLLGWMKCYR